MSRGAPHWEASSSSGEKSTVPAGQQAQSLCSEKIILLSVSVGDARSWSLPPHLAVAGLLSLCALCLCFSLPVLISQRSKSLVRTETALSHHFFSASFILSSRWSFQSLLLPSIAGLIPKKSKCTLKSQRHLRRWAGNQTKIRKSGLCPPPFVFWPLPCVWPSQLVRENNSWQQFVLQKSPSSYASS